MNILPQEQGWGSVLGQALSQAIAKQQQQRQTEASLGALGFSTDQAKALASSGGASGQNGGIVQEMMKGMVAQKFKDIPVQRSAEALKQEGHPESWAYLTPRVQQKKIEEAQVKEKLAEEQKGRLEELGGKPQPDQQPFPQPAPLDSPLAPQPVQQQIDQLQPQPLGGQPPEVQGQVPQQITPQEQISQQSLAQRDPTAQQSDEEITQLVRDGKYTVLKEMFAPREGVGATFEDYYSRKQDEISKLFDDSERSILSKPNLSPLQKDKLLSRVTNERTRAEEKLEKGASRAERAFSATDSFRTKLSDGAKTSEGMLEAANKVLVLLEKGNIDNPVVIGLLEDISPAAKEAFLTGDTQEMISLLPKFLGTTLKENFSGQINQKEFETFKSTIPSEKLKSEVIRRMTLAKKGEAELIIVKDRLANRAIEANGGKPPLNLNSIVTSNLSRYRKAIGSNINHLVKTGKVPSTGSLLSDTGWRALGITRDMIPLAGAVIGGSAGFFFGGPAGAAAGGALGSVLASRLIGEKDISSNLINAGIAAATMGGGTFLRGAAGVAVKSGGAAARRVGALKAGGKILKKVGLGKLSGVFTKAASKSVAAQTAIKTAASQTAKEAAMEAFQTGTSILKKPNSWSTIDWIQRGAQSAKIAKMTPSEAIKYAKKMGRKI